MNTFNIFEKRELKLMKEDEGARNEYVSPNTPNDQSGIANAMKNPTTTGVTIPAGDLSTDVQQTREIEVTPESDTAAGVMDAAKKITDGLSPQDKKTTAVTVKTREDVNEMRNHSIRFTKKELNGFLKNL